MNYTKEQSIETIRDRIALATVKSPIAVFVIRVGSHTALTSVFADTILTRRRIKYKDPDLVGVYHQKSNENDVKRDLALALNS